MYFATNISTFPHFHISTFLSEWILKTLIQAFYLQLYDIKPILDLLQLLHSLIILSLKSFNLIINALIYQNMSDEIIISSPWYAAYMTWVRSEKFVYNREYFNRGFNFNYCEFVAWSLRSYKKAFYEFLVLGQRFSAKFKLKAQQSYGQISAS